MDKIEFLDKFIFFELENLNDGFDVKTIKHFSESDFRIILERAEKLKVIIHGIEPWKDGEFYDVLSSEDFNDTDKDSNWYWKAFQQFIDSGESLVYAASYEIPRNLLMEI